MRTLADRTLSLLHRTPATVVFPPGRRGQPLLWGLLASLLTCTAHAQDAPHPPMGGRGSGHGTAGRGLAGGPAQDRSQPDPSLALGTVVVQVVDAQENPVQKAEVELTTHYQSIEEGDSDNTAVKTPNAAGEAVFSELSTGLRMSYSVRVKSNGGHYEIPSFRLGKTGQRLVVHVYPSTSDLKQAFVGFRGLTYIQMREDTFHVNMMYRVINMSDHTFLPKDVTISLPSAAEAVDVQTKVGDAGFVQQGQKVRLVGTFPPGHKDLQFSFQIENTNESELSFEVGAVPHLAEQRVLVEEIPGMELYVPGFGAVNSTQGPDDKSVLFAQKAMEPGQAPLGQVRIELSGLPTVGPGRWLAVAVALCFAVGGLLVTFLRRGQNSQELSEQKELARSVLLNEMQLLEVAKAKEKIGPRTYEQTKREILLALARLEPPTSQA
jgi:hypothetical protein